MKNMMLSFVVVCAMAVVGCNKKAEPVEAAEGEGEPAVVVVPEPTPAPVEATVDAGPAPVEGPAVAPPAATP